MGILEKEIKKVFAVVVLVIVSVAMSGCVYADNKSWGDMTYEEKQEVSTYEEKYEDMKESVEDVEYFKHKGEEIENME